MMQESRFEDVVRLRLRGLRKARGWSLDDLAARAHLSASTVSRIETGRQGLNLEQVRLLARALGTSLDVLVESTDDSDVLIRPETDEQRGLTTWLLSRGGEPAGLVVAKQRITRTPSPDGTDELGVHPGSDWFTVLHGTAVLLLDDRRILVQTGQAAQFSTMVPHAIRAHEEPVEILIILDRNSNPAHLDRG
ncbi:helix-turn-helix domain-containing protein [Nocardia sp. NPDC050712]|uniref:helix-turn-helix domain-containing protein n=1 Tax=Nocardia sp. NPDC050712 TaxID=3155518 RepID=UPI0033E7B21D